MLPIQSYFKKYGKEVNQALDRYLIKASTYPKRTHEAIRYAVFSGGKRIRPILTITFSEAVGRKSQQAMLTACAIECIHAYSLVHDDLPCMDDDNHRRGKLTVHKKFDEATAVLTGDALLTFAFELVSRIKPASLSVRVAQIVTQAAGTLGMIGGQAVDKEYESKKMTLPVMDYINIHKTGKLIAASCLAGAVVGGASKREERIALQYGEHLGMVFQLIDDVIDNDGYVTFGGKQECLHRAEELTENAKKLVAKLPKKQQVLFEIADFVLERRK